MTEDKDKNDLGADAAANVTARSAEPQVTGKHTPGPWKWFDYPDGRKILIAPSQAVIFCPDAAMDVDEADKHLLAAAPELIGAAKNLRAKQCDYMADRGNEAKGVLVGIAARALDDAIAKAEGR
jgi:Pyruvate/2-oxoacid:ferredoxin oxidoreductase delta subunit